MADNKFFNMFNDIDEKYIKEAQLPKDGLDMYPDYSSKPLKRRAIPLAIISAAACAALVFGVVKLSGTVGNVDRMEGIVISSGFGSYDPVYTLFGTPLPADELEDFDYSAAVSSYRQTFSAELTSALDSIGKPELTEVYAKAITLADMTGCGTNTDFIITDAVKAKKNRAYITVTVPSMNRLYPDSTYYMYETGYRYDGFVQAFREVFGDASADNMIMLSKRGFLNYNGQLYCEEENTTVTEIYGLVYTDYEIVTNEDDEVVFNTVCYYDYADEWLKKEVLEPYDPANKDTYLNREGKRFIGTFTNRMVKMDGVWKAEDICYGAHNQTLKYPYDNARAHITDKYALDGEPFPSSVHTDFEYEEELSEYTEELKKDEALTELLESIGDSGFTDHYYRARTLAEILALNEKALPERSECMGSSIGAGLSFFDEYNQVCDRYLELGYNYDSFFDAAHEIFSNDTFNYLMSHGTYYDYNNELYYAATSFTENPLLVHSEYELVTHTDDMIAFNTVCYHIRPEDYDPYADRVYPYKQAFDPSDKDKYEVTRVANVFVKVDGKWKTESICFLGDKSSAGESGIDIYTDDRGNMFKLTGEPLAESKLRDFDYEGMLEYCRESYNEDELLTELLDGLGRPEVKDLYYRARTLADIAAMKTGAGYEALAAHTYEPEHERAQITMLKDTPPSFYSTIDPSYKEGQIFRETCVSYDSFIDALNDVFIEESAAWLLARFPFFYEYDGQLYCNRVSAGWPITLIHTEYELVENSADTVKFTTKNYYIPFGTMGADTDMEYNPEKKDSYLTSEINNEFRYIDGEWKTYEVCTLADYSSREGKMFNDPTEAS